MEFTSGQEINQQIEQRERSISILSGKNLQNYRYQNKRMILNNLRFLSTN